MATLERPPTRGELNRLLAANALTKTWPNVVVPAVLAILGVVLGVFAYALPVALVAYLALSTVTYLDGDEAERVGARLRSGRREALAAGETRVDVDRLARPIAERLRQARSREQRIRGAIGQADLPFSEVSEEVDRFVRLMEKTAGRAQLLHDELADSPPEEVEARLVVLRREGDPARSTLVGALETQLATLRKMQRQLDGFFAEMDLVLVEMDTVRGMLISVGASTEAAAQQEVAGEVRALREQMGAVAEGMSETFEEGGLGARQSRAPVRPPA